MMKEIFKNILKDYSVTRVEGPDTKENGHERYKFGYNGREVQVDVPPQGSGPIRVRGLLIKSSESKMEDVDSL